MKRILIISDYFPPIGSVASLRSAYVSVAFQQRGWEVFVVCRQLDDRHFIDNTITGLPAESNIHRVIIKETNGENIISKTKNLFHKIFQPEYYRDKKNLYDSYYNKSSEVIEKFKIDHIYTSCGPEATILIGYNLKKKYNLNWIADLRDIPEMYKFVRITDIIYKKALIRRQSKHLRLATLVITVSDPLAGTLESRICREVEVVLNGFDLDLHTKASYPKSFTNFNFVYTGQLYDIKNRDPRPVFQALDNLISAKKLCINHLKIDFYGTEFHVIDNLKRNYLCGHKITLHGHCSLNESILRQHEAYVLIMLNIIGQKGIYSTKLFDYLASSRPIIVFPDDKDVVNALISKYDAGICSENLEDIEKAIFFWYTEWLKGSDLRTQRNLGDIEVLSRQFQCNKLVTMVEGL